MTQRMHDAVYRNLFSHPEVVADLLARHCHGWLDVGALDPGSLRQVPGTTVGEDSKQRRADVAWTVAYRGGGRRMVLNIEFQSTRDPTMHARALAYGTRLQAREGLRKRAPDGPDGYPDGLAVVIYNGRDTWRPRGAGGPGGPGEAPNPARMSPWSPFYLLDMRELAARESHEKSLILWIARAEAIPITGAEGLRQYVLRRFGGNEHQSLQHAVLMLIKDILRATDVDPEVVEKATTLTEAEPMLATATDHQKRWMAEGRAKGRAEGRAGAVCQAARIRHGAAAAAELEELLAQAVGGIDTAQILRAILETATGAEMAARVKEWLAENGPRGD